MVALKTFQNLTIGRQEEIIAICLEEFALYDYQSASLSNIISRLGLAKGSFYRYFENKQSLYFFLLEYCTYSRIEHDKAYIDHSIADFFQLIIKHTEARFYFDKKHPLQSAFLYNVLHEKNSDELGNIQLISKQKSLEMIHSLVKEYVHRGVLRKYIQAELMAMMILQAQLMLFDYIALRYKVDFRKNIKSRKPIYNIPIKELVKATKQIVDILKSGMANTKSISQ